MLFKIVRLLRHHTHAQILLSIALAFCLPSFVGVDFIRWSFGISTFFVDTLLFVLPIIVFTFIATALSHIESKNLWVVILVFACVMVSNITAVLTACGYAYGIFEFLDLRPCAGFTGTTIASITPAFKVHFPHICSSRFGLVLGLVYGVIAHLFHRHMLFKKVSDKVLGTLNKGVVFFLTSVFVPLIPVYVFGFCIKLSYEDALVHLFTRYGCVFLAGFMLVIVYILCLYILGSGSIKRVVPALKNMLPAGLMGFSTMSGAAAMPLAIEGAIKNTYDAPLSKLIIPTSTNIHMIGDNIIITITALSLALISGTPFPDFASLFMFACAFAVAKLSCVGVPGASVLVILPVLEQHLGFSPSMIGVLTTIYILQDSIGTASNVMANGAFAMIVKRLYSVIRLKKEL